jgi:hypothetical protein
LVANHAALMFRRHPLKTRSKLCMPFLGEYRAGLKNAKIDISDGWLA